MLNAEFSLNTLLTAMRQIGCGDPHPVFAGGLRYIPPSSKHQVGRAAFEELSQYGFTQGHGFTPEFEEILRLLDRPSIEYFAYAKTLTEQLSVLVAVQGRTAVRALCQGERVQLDGVTHPGDALIAGLPGCRPAPIKTFSLPQREFQEPQDVSDVFDDAPARSRAAQELDSLFEQPYYGIGQLYAAKREDGQRVESSDSLSYLDLDAGRVGIGLAHGYISVLPGDPAELGRKLATMN